MLADSVKIKGCHDVYEPREDSYMLAEAVERYAFGRVLDMGTGSGLQGVVAALKGCSVTFSDISEKAIKCAKQNAACNGVNGRFIISDMFSNIEGKFNTLIFNPPYLPGGKHRFIAHSMHENMALDGGPDGRRYVDIFIKEYTRYAEREHVVLLLESSLDKFENDMGAGVQVIARKRFFFEELAVLMLP